MVYFHLILSRNVIKIFILFFKKEKYPFNIHIQGDLKKMGKNFTR